jgi:hypothetical protein
MILLTIYSIKALMFGLVVGFFEGKRILWIKAKPFASAKVRDSALMGGQGS